MTPLDVTAQRVAVDVGRKLDDHAVVAGVDLEPDYGGGHAVRRAMTEPRDVRVCRPSAAEIWRTAWLTARGPP